jgi:hypothetical protein
MKDPGRIRRLFCRDGVSLSEISRKVGVYDLAWSCLAGGGWNLRPVSDFNAMPERCRKFRVAVARAPGKSIYEIAKSILCRSGRCLARR